MPCRGPSPLPFAITTSAATTLFLAIRRLTAAVQALFVVTHLSSTGLGDPNAVLGHSVPDSCRLDLSTISAVPAVGIARELVIRLFLLSTLHSDYSCLRICGSAKCVSRLKLMKIHKTSNTITHEPLWRTCIAAGPRYDNNFTSTLSWLTMHVQETPILLQAMEGCILPRPLQYVPRAAAHNAI